METITTTTTEQYLENAIVETFIGNTYSVFDYSNEDDFIYINNPKKDVYKIDSTSLELTAEDVEKVFDMVHSFINENTEEDSTEEKEDDYYPTYNHAI